MDRIGLPQMGIVIFYSSDHFYRSGEIMYMELVCSILGGRIETSREFEDDVR